MGIRRGSFESVSPTTAVAKPVLSSSKRSTFRPDIGRNLRTGALALDAWSDAFGKMAQTSKAMKGKIDANKQAMYKTAADSDATTAALENFESETLSASKQAMNRAAQEKDAAATAYSNYINAIMDGGMKADSNVESELRGKLETATKRASMAKTAYDNNVEIHDRLQKAAESSARRRDVAKGLGLFSNNFDYNKRY